MSPQSRELEICVHSRDGEVMVLSGMLYLRLEDYFDTSSSTHCLPLEPQGILLAEVRGGEHTQGGRGEREGAGGRRERGESGREAREERGRG